jgi:NAD(P)-dependent dehydrogenase (short-subunit alcohol dehydrogenase family)
MANTPAHGRELEGQVALVTGAARGIGAATARALAGAGATVCLADVLPCEPVVQELARGGADARGFYLDIRNREACAGVVADVLHEFGRVDILVCNAGVCPPGTVAGDWEQWNRVIDVNVNGTQHCIAAVWTPMVARGGGRIVIVSSMAYYRGGVIVGTEYSASKAALIGMTRHLARNGGPLGILCNAVAPGFIDTDMTADFEKPDLASVPLRRQGTADDVAGPIRFLCGPDSAYMTGTVLNVTGGIVLGA